MMAAVELQFDDYIRSSANLYRIAFVARVPIPDLPQLNDYHRRSILHSLWMSAIHRDKALAARAKAAYYATPPGPSKP